MFQLKKVSKGIYFLSFDDHLDLVSHFMRFQEIYESQNELFHNQPFQLIDFQRWYIKDRKDSGKDFTYYSDWSGFNLPLNVITKFYDKLVDKNNHDHLMMQIANYVIRDNGSDDCYLIGTGTGSLTTMKHEIAHGLYYTNVKYKNDMDKLFFNLKQDKKDKLFKTLEEWGYHQDVFIDEIQAYLSTGLYGEMRAHITSGDTKPFRDIFDKCYSKMKIK